MNRVQMTRYPLGLFSVVILFLTGLSASTAEPEKNPPATNVFRKVVLEADRDLDGDGKIEDTLPDIMEIAVAADGRVFYVERAGTVRVWRPETKTSAVLGKLQINKELEDGLLGIAQRFVGTTQRQQQRRQRPRQHYQHQSAQAPRCCRCCRCLDRG